MSRWALNNFIPMAFPENCDGESFVTLIVKKSSFVGKHKQEFDRREIAIYKH